MSVTAYCDITEYQNGRKQPSEAAEADRQPEQMNRAAEKRCNGVADRAKKNSRVVIPCYIIY